MIDTKIGISAIDKEHAILISIFDTLIAEPITRKTKLKADLAQTRRLIKSHFEHEEFLMEQYDYARAPEHTLRHTIFINEFDSFIASIPSSEQSLVEHLDLCKKWFISHIMTHDRRLGLFLQENGLS